MEILNLGFDHIEYSLRDIRPMQGVFARMGFEKIGERTLPLKGTRSVAMAQGSLRVILTQPEGSQSPFANSAKAANAAKSTQFLQDHAEGVCALGLEVRDATEAFNEAVQRGARPAHEPEVFKSDQGTVVRSEIWTPGDLRYAFVERHPNRASDSSEGPVLFDEGLIVSRLKSPSPLGISQIDHLTNNVGIGEMKEWVDFYQQIFGFSVTRHFDIRTGRTGLISEVVESADHRIKVPINEATEPESQVQEFVNRMKGAGVQHLALLTSDIQRTLIQLRAQGFKFLTVPHAYYEAIPARVPGVSEDLSSLEELGILLDGEGGGYLLQIFSEEVLGPFFFEFIQRKGNQGFGEGNFRALFEAIERDQLKRGVLS